MTLPVPILDDRTFQDIVDEAKKRIPAYFDGWTDHNVSDPGVTLIELFAWMTEMLIYRMNQVPDLHASQFLEMFGLIRQPPLPSKVNVTFQLSKPQPTNITIPQGTEVSTTQTKTEPSITFATESTFVIYPPEMKTVLYSRSAEQQDDGDIFTPLANIESDLLASTPNVDAVPVPLFSDIPKDGEGVCFGFATDISHYRLTLKFACVRAGGNAIIESKPPLVWEIYHNGRFRPLPPQEEDTTKGFNAEQGQITLHIPQINEDDLGGNRGYWLRVRVMTEGERNNDNREPYRASPSVSHMLAEATGCTVPAVHAETMPRELLGYSDGTPGQTFRLRATPVIARAETEHLIVVQPNGDHEAWTEVDDFVDKTSADRCYTLNSATGEIRLGPAIRKPDGQASFYGVIPPRGAALYFSRYRHHTEQNGNVAAGKIDTPKASIPFVDKVNNHQPASGGRQLESMAHLKLRATRQWRTIDRAVTAQDYESLTWERFRDAVSRVKCLQPRALDTPNRIQSGQVFVLVIPIVEMEGNGRLLPEQLKPNDALLDNIQAFLDERRLLTTRLSVRAPELHRVSVELTAMIHSTANPLLVRRAIANRLNNFLNPISGGPDYTGWPFGHDLSVTDVYICLQNTPGVFAIEQINLYPVGANGERQPVAAERVPVVEHGLILGDEHIIHIQDAI